MKNIFLGIIILLWVLGCEAQEKSLCGEVNPFIGTGFHGHTYPGATVPFGGVQLSPDTRRGNWDACAGYHYSDSLLFGFSHTHLSGTGCADLGDILFCPYAGKLQPGREREWKHPLRFSHSGEWAEPGYYKVVLPTEDIQVELTASPYVGVHRYCFGREGISSVVIDMAHLLTEETIKEVRLKRTALDEICGMRCTQGWVDNQYVYFVARFSRPFRQLIWVKNNEVDSSSLSVEGGQLQAIATFEGKAGDTLEIQVGLSLVSEDNAWENLEHNVRNRDFEAVRQEAARVWENALSAIRVEGGPSAARQNFYTALYHSMVAPNRVNDVNGDYRKHDGTIGRVGSGRTRYSTFSLWDTFRAWHPLMTLLDTSLVNDMVNSMLAMYEISGELPIWPLSSGETGTMIGYHAVSVIADAWLKGIRGFDGKKALKAMVVSAEKNKKGAEEYIRLGFIPADVKKESVSCLLEFAYDDWAISRMAAQLGEEEIAARFARRSRTFTRVFDGSTRFFRGKRSDGNWETPFDPYEIGRSYTEATAWQYRFYVPHDVNGLINLYGGRDLFVRELDSLFTVSSHVVGSLSDITGLLGQYAHGNEPSHHIAYLYNYAGQPWKTQEMTRRLLELMYQPTPEGICGNEDCGQMSAWYIMTTLGMYPVCPGSGEFVLTTPLFPKATLQLGNGKKLLITANEPEKNVYIHRVWWNGKEVVQNFITYAQLMEGGELRFELGTQPDKSRGRSEACFPYSFSRGQQVSIPFVRQDLHLFEEQVQVELGSATPHAEIRYTLDGRIPGPQSSLYQKPFVIGHSCVLKARGFKAGYAPAEMLELQATKAVYHPGEDGKDLIPGVRFRYFEGNFKHTTELETAVPVRMGVMSVPSIAEAGDRDHWGYIWEGWIFIPQKGIYEFMTNSDDGSVLFINGEKVVDNDGSHGAVTAMGRVALGQGYHPFKLLYFEDYEGQSFSWGWRRPGQDVYQPIPREQLFIR